jgi:hypothetical protein
MPMRKALPNSATRSSVKPERSTMIQKEQSVRDEGYSEAITLASTKGFDI